MTEKMKQTMVGNTVVAVLPVAMPNDEETQAMIVMELLLKVLIYFPRGMVLSKYNKLFATIFPTIALQDNGGWVPLLNSARDTMLEWGWIVQTKIDAPKTKFGFYNIVCINPSKKDDIVKVLTDSDYDGWLEIAMTNIVQDQPKSSVNTSSSRGFDKFRAKVETNDIPF